MCLTVLRELADSTAEFLCFISERLWEIRGSPERLYKDKYIPISKREDLGNYRPMSLKSVPKQIMKQALMEVVSIIVKDKVIGKSQHGFTSGKCVTN